MAGRNVPHKGHKGAPQAGLVSFWSLIPACWRISPAPESHSQEGRNRGCKSQTPCGPRAEAGIWENPPEGGKGLLSHGSLVTKGELAAWQRSHKDQLGRARAGAQAGLASGIIWHLEPQQSLGVSTASQSPETCPWGGRFRRAKVREHGSEAWLLEWGHMYLVVLRALSGHSCRKSRSKACSNQQLPV